MAYEGDRKKSRWEEQSSDGETAVDRETEYQYNKLGELVESSRKDNHTDIGSAVTYTYDGAENRTGGNTTVYTYNDLDQLTKAVSGGKTSGTRLYTYDDYGTTMVSGKQDTANELAYTGGVYDKTTEEYYLNARYYSPEDGRFLSMDTRERGEYGVSNLESIWVLWWRPGELCGSQWALAYIIQKSTEKL